MKGDVKFLCHVCQVVSKVKYRRGLRCKICNNQLFSKNKLKKGGQK